MRNKRKLALLFVLLFVIVYIIFGVWIAQDTKMILKEGMKRDPNMKYMSRSAYEHMNPVERGMTADTFEYRTGSHHIGFVFPLHFFFVSKVYVTQEYENNDLAFREPVNLTLKLKSGNWFVTKVDIKP